MGTPLVHGRGKGSEVRRCEFGGHGCNPHCCWRGSDRAAPGISYHFLRFLPPGLHPTPGAVWREDTERLGDSILNTQKHSAQLLLSWEMSQYCTKGEFPSCSLKLMYQVGQAWAFPKYDFLGTSCIWHEENDVAEIREMCKHIINKNPGQPFLFFLICESNIPFPWIWRLLPAAFLIFQALKLAVLYQSSALITNLAIP